MSGAFQGEAEEWGCGSGAQLAPSQLAVVSDHRGFWTEISALGEGCRMGLAGPFPIAQAAKCLNKARARLAVIHSGGEDGDALGLIRGLAGGWPPLRILLVVDAIDSPFLVQAATVGVSAILVRPPHRVELVAAIQAATTCGLYLAPKAASLLSQAGIPPRPACRAGARLTPREMEILQLEAAGLLYKEIAARLGVSEHTVNNHLYAIRQQLGVHTAIEAIHAVFCAGCARFDGNKPP